MSVERISSRWVLAALLWCSLPATVSAQPGADASPAKGAKAANQLAGLVVDVIGKPMSGIEVYLARTDRSVRTDSRGVWRFEDPPIGPHVVVTRALGYVPYIREVVIGSTANDSLTLILRRYPQTLSKVEVTAKSNLVTSDASIVAERLTQMKSSAGRLFTRDQILEQRPYSLAELLQGIPGVMVQRGQGEIIATNLRAGVGGGIRNVDGSCQLQFYLNNSPIESTGVAGLDPMTFRSVEVYPQTVLIPGLSQHPDKCGAIVINMMRR